MQSNEKKLVKRAKAGDRGAFEGLIRECGDKIMKTAYHFAGNIHDAEDLMQEVTIKAYRNINRFRSDSSFFTWVYRILINQFQNTKRYKDCHGLNKTGSLDEKLSYNTETESKTVAEIIPDTGITPEKQIEFSETQRLFQKSLAQLQDKEKTLIVLKDIQDKSCQEISEIMEIPLGSVTAGLFSAREKLRIIFSELKDGKR